MEITRAIRSPDPSSYISHFPVHQDGSCNVLQHYAAMGLDDVGAASVNLKPSPLPQDVYSVVVDQVELERRQDAEKGLKIAQILKGFVKRKVIKQTIMTTNYGVTMYGARQQISRQLRDLDDFPNEYVPEASNYLAQKTFLSLRELFRETRKIQVNQFFDLSFIRCFVSLGLVYGLCRTHFSYSWNSCRMEHANESTCYSTLLS